MYVSALVRGPVDCEPFGLLLPDHAPDALHEVVLALVQVSVDALPDSTVGGEARSVAVGPSPLTVTVVLCVEEPPGPVQVNSYSVVLVREPVSQLPLV